MANGGQPSLHKGERRWDLDIGCRSLSSSSSVSPGSYNPFEGPNENPEAELPLTAGEYIYIYGNMDEDGFFEGRKAVGSLCSFLCF